MNIQRILQNDLTIVAARSNEGKSMLLINLIKEYKEQFKGDVWVYGLNDEIATKLKANSFKSLEELEQIKNSVVVIDEVSLLFDLENRKKAKQIDRTLRLVNHNNNKIVLCGLPFDFKKYISAKAKCFLFKTLKISDLVNGSDAKERIYQYAGKEKGAYLLNVPKDEVICYDGHYWKENITYYKEYDTKLKNVSLFVPKKTA